MGTFECEECGGTEWLVTVSELSVMRVPVVYTALKCKKCGALYPIKDLGKGVRRDQVKAMLR